MIYSIKILFSYVLQDITPDTCILIALLDYYGDDVHVDIQRGETHPSFWSTGKIVGQPFIKFMYSETCL